MNPYDVGRPLCGLRPERGPGIQALPAHLHTKELDGRPPETRFMTRSSVSSECVRNMFPQSAHLSEAGSLFCSGCAGCRGDSCIMQARAPSGGLAVT